MKVLKFGGSSVANAKNINRVIDIILKSPGREDGMAVVVSALGGVTDELIRLVTLSSERSSKWRDLLQNICERHYRIVKKLVKKEYQKEVLQKVAEKYKELEEVTNKIYSAQKSSARLLNTVLSFGEQLSAYIISEAIKSRGVLFKFIDARTVIKTDSNFGSANVDIENSYKLISKIKQPFFIMGGFIASNKNGATTTLGRGGSDYTASLIGAALDASAIEIWTDVDGLMTADPRKIKNAISIPEISYEEAEKMALSGAKVIHPKTMKPARLKGIPIYIKNTFNPKAVGTRISDRKKREAGSKIPVGILGATGMVGQRLMSLLKNHPWFEVTAVAASRKSAGKKLDHLNLFSIKDDIDIISQKCKFVFSAINTDKNFIKKIEESYAAKGLPVVSNNSSHRWTADVPMIIPEINADHLDIIPTQKKNHGWTTGFIVVKPNCSVQSYVPLLHAWKNFKPKEVIVSTYQAISGAGKTFSTWPEMIDNVIPYIDGGEEEKSEKEPKKILGDVKKGKFILKNNLQISASCVRVPVTDGHMAVVNTKFGKKVSKDALVKALKNFKSPLSKLNLPSAPKPFIKYFKEQNRPQTKLDRDLGNGMGVSVGRLREDSVLGWKCVALSHNTIRGAAGGSILTAELLVKKGYIK